MERKLATIQKIENISPIKDADNIVVARILGWQAVVKKGEFKEGDLVIYCEVDSVLPEKPEYEFLRARKFRIKTIKLKGVVSQGLVLPISVLPDNKKWKVGDDVTEVLDIIKYISPAEQNEEDELLDRARKTKNPVIKYLMKYRWFRKLIGPKKSVKGFPWWAQKTDEERINSMPGVLEKFKHHTVYVTEKIDYQSATFTSKRVPRKSGFLGKLLGMKTIFVVCTRKYQTNNKSTLYWEIAKKYDLEYICKQYPGIIIQGEQGNTKVQGNKYRIAEPKLWVYNVINSNNDYHYDYDEMVQFCEQNNLTPVPLIKKCLLSELGSTVDELVEFSKGKSVLNGKIKREGIVVRAYSGGKKVISFKVINPEFLLEYE